MNSKTVILIIGTILILIGIIVYLSDFVNFSPLIGGSDYDGSSTESGDTWNRCRTESGRIGPPENHVCQPYGECPSGQQCGTVNIGGVWNWCKCIPTGTVVKVNPILARDEQGDGFNGRPSGIDR